nr:MAG TPA: hypothetical protein [Caudoviricetes sp.]
MLLSISICANMMLKNKATNVVILCFFARCLTC